MLWTRKETDEALNLILGANTEAAYFGNCDKHAKANKRPNGTLVERYVWGLAVRYKEYCGPSSYREDRTGLPFTWAEEHFIVGAYKCQSEKEREPTTPEYLALFLNRPLEEAKAAWHKYGPAQGRPGINLKPVPLDQL